MSDSLDKFIRDAMQEHDGAGTSDLATVTTSESSAANDLGALPGHNVEGLIARGGMGAIYRARQQALEREVAVKVMTRLADSPEMATRFRREALVLGRLAHPNIVPVYDIGTDDEGQLFYTMKLVKGRTLQAILHDLRSGDPHTQQQHSLTSLLTVFRKVCDAIAFAHSQDVLHRDLKPENIMVGEFGEVLVMDWGLAKQLRADEWIVDTPGTSAPSTTPALPSATLAGSVMGTPQYMSPEQALGQIAELDERSDIFSLGGILYAILTLRPPVEGKTPDEVLVKVRTGTVIPPADMQVGTAARRTRQKDGTVPQARLIRPLPHTPGGRVPPALSAVVMQALRRSKSERYQTVAALSADIEAYQGGFATSAEQAGAWRQLKLLMLRHKMVTASLVVMLFLTAGFILKVMSSERKALAEKEATRRALALSQVALADAAFRNRDLGEMLRALDSCPEDLRDQSWRYLWDKRDASSRDVKLSGFEDPSAVLAVSGSPGHFAMAATDGRIAIMDATSDRVLKTIDSGITQLHDIVLSGDGRVLGALDREGKVLRLFDVETSAVLRSAALKNAQVGAMALSHDGSLLAFMINPTAIDAELQLLDTRDNRLLWQFHCGFIRSLTFHPDGSRIFTCGSGRWRHSPILRTADGSVVAQYDGYAWSHALSRDGRTLALGTWAGEVCLLDSATGKELQSSRLHTGPVYQMEWTSDGHLLTAGSSGRFDDQRWVLRIVEPHHLLPVETLFGLPHGPETFWSLNPESGDLLTLETPPRLWRLPVGRELIKTTHTASEQGRCACFLSETMLLARLDFSLGRYELTPSDKTMRLLDKSPAGFSIAASHPPSQTYAYAQRTGSKKVRAGFKIFSFQDGQVKETLDQPLDSVLNTLTFDAAGKRILTAGRHKEGAGPLEVFDVHSGASLLKIPGTFTSAVFSGPSGNVAAVDSRSRTTGSVDERLVLLDGRTGALLHTTIYDFQIDALAVSPDGRWVALGGTDQRIHLYDAGTLHEKTSFRVHDAEVTAVTFHPTAPFMATASADMSVKLWDYETARQITHFSGFGGTPVSLAFSPGGSLLAVDGQERTSRIFDVSAYFKSAPTPPPLVVSKDKNPPRSQAASPAAPDGWTDLLASLTPASLAQSDSGWLMEKGVLHGQEKTAAKLPLPGNFQSLAYRLRLKLRRRAITERGKGFHLGLPFGGHRAGLLIDGTTGGGFQTSIVRVNGLLGKDIPDALQGRQVTDTAPHDFEISVHITGADTTVIVTRDLHPFYTWTGPLASLTQIQDWAVPPGTIALCTKDPDWEVHAVSVRRE
ncbi:WD40 repeat domain-containing serine/threonine protein kinase [Prosthecobacter sp.]|uniref:WD40 repeat domain-containing serine/threonine protein kinase n=1 Tax=Prosthecobacter sp. TaxID=1965333 RepID=UPI003782DD9C